MSDNRNSKYDIAEDGRICGYDKKGIIITDSIGVLICLILYGSSMICNVSTYANLFDLDSNNLKGFMILRIILYVCITVLLLFNLVCFIFKRKQKTPSKKLIIIALLILVTGSFITVAIVNKNYTCYECDSAFSTLGKKEKIFNLISYDTYDDRYCEVSELFKTKSVRLQQSNNESAYIMDYIESDSRAVIQQYFSHYKRLENLKTFKKIQYKDDCLAYYVENNITFGNSKSSWVRCLFLKDNMICAIDYSVETLKTDRPSVDEVLLASFELLAQVRNR